MQTFDFDSLPAELKLQVLRSSDIASLIHLSNTSVYYRNICSSMYDYLWKPLTYDLIHPFSSYDSLHHFNTINHTGFNTWFQVYVYFYILSPNLDTLTYEITYGHIEMVNYLANHGIDLSFQNGRALSIAAKNGHLHIIKYLQSNVGLDIHINNDETLIQASSGGHLNVVQYLVEHGCNVNTLGGGGYQGTNCMPLVVAARGGHLDIVCYLLDNGANESNIGKDQALVYAILWKHFDIVKLLVEQGVPIIPFHLNNAVGANLNIVKYLAQHTNFTKNDIDFALILASSKGDLDIVKYLVEQMGADVHTDNNAPSLEAALNENYEIEQYLLSVS